MYGYSSPYVDLCECIFMNLLVTVITMFGKCIYLKLNCGFIYS